MVNVNSMAVFMNSLHEILSCKYEIKLTVNFFASNF
jgi:hypothetical protein